MTASGCWRMTASEGRMAIETRGPEIGNSALIIVDM
jgi:hypothetical protein